ncbi:glycosyltransferase family 25 protein [Rhizobium sp. A41-96]
MMLSSQIESSSLGRSVPPLDILEAASERNSKMRLRRKITNPCVKFDEGARYTQWSHAKLSLKKTGLCADAQSYKSRRRLICADGKQQVCSMSLTAFAESPLVLMQPIPVYLINIDRAADRLAEIERQSGEFGFRFERINGVDGALVPRDQWIDVDHARFERRHGRTILSGEYGCYRSHLAALRKFLASGDDMALVIEDDVALDADFLTRAVATKEAAPTADLIKLVNHRWRGFRATANSRKGDVVGRCLFGPQGSTACYLVTRKGAEKIVKALAVMSLPWDVAIERGWDMHASIFTTNANIVGFSRLQRSTMIGWRRDYRAAKASPWRRIPAHLFRTLDFFRRIAYILTTP